MIFGKDRVSSIATPLFFEDVAIFFVLPAVASENTVRQSGGC